MHDRFFQLQTAVHFPQIGGDSSKLQKVQTIVQHFSEQFQAYYVPEQQVSIDESLIGFDLKVGTCNPIYAKQASPQIWIQVVLFM